MLNVLIADDHEMVRRAVGHVVGARLGWNVCGETGDGSEVLALALRLRPDVVVQDISMPGLNGIAVTKQIRASLPATEVLIFTMHDDDETAIWALSAGARGYLLKTDGEDRLVAAIEALGAHRPYFSPAIEEMLLNSTIHKRPNSPLEGFTIQQLVVGQMTAEGCTTEQIARRLDISIKTVENHRAGAMRKAGVDRTADFVRFAIRHKLAQA